MLAMPRSTKSAVIKLEKIRKVYKTGDEDTVALDDIDLTIERGEFVAIMGPSGSGKSTLMHIIGLLDSPSSGEYYLSGERTNGISKRRIAAIRNQEIGFVFQQFNLLPRTTVRDNLLLPTVYGDLKSRNDRVKEMLNKVGLTDRERFSGNQLSGGQIQRVAIARALMMNPSLILADEPTGNLDSKKAHEIMDVFTEINAQGATIVLITHEEDIARFAKRIIQIKDGKLLSDRTKS